MSLFNVTENKTLPPNLESLPRLIENMWWSWNQESFLLFEKMNPEVWKETRNPVLAFNSCTQERFHELSQDNSFTEQLEQLRQRFDQYMEKNDRWYHQLAESNEKNKETSQNLIAYFCAEYGIHESLPIYSGGLGILAGDHIKSASDLGLPMIFIGLYYSNGYFTQEIDANGKQKDVYHNFPAKDLPVSLVANPNMPQKALEIQLDFPGRQVYLNVWKAKVGSVAVYLLDSKHDKNSPQDQELTARLYGGDREMRIAQEFILGIGGYKALKELGLSPNVYHMNEGHSGFFQIERIRQTMIRENLTFEEAKIKCAANCLFTTHTPVPAGNETFSLELMHKYFYPLVKELNISWHRFLEFGMVDEKTDYKYFSLTLFALNVSRFYNGVSELHGQIASKMWKKRWPNIPEVLNPISHITNGVHIPTWMGLETKKLVEKNLGENWQDAMSDSSFWKKINQVPYSEIVQCQRSAKEKLITLTKEYLSAQLKRQNKSIEEIQEVDRALNPNTLTIGFARRFATYKRATLIFQDLKRLERIVNNPERPVQFIFAGKAHPQDIPGQNFIEEIYQISRRPEFRGKIIILENYDMNISSHMVAGVDVWLNTPRRPMEASGTSGQKVPLNFGLNFSVLDGWWREGHNGDNGWKIGDQKDYPTQEAQDQNDAQDFYNTLEQTIIPLYYQSESKDLKTHGLSKEWVEKCRESMISNIARFSTHRMVQDYWQKFYSQALEYGKSFRGDDQQEKVQNYIVTRRFFRRNWNNLCLSDVSWGENVCEIESNHHAFDSTPSHHVDFTLNQLLPGRIFKAKEINLQGRLYLGDFVPEQLNVALVCIDQKEAEKKQWAADKIDFHAVTLGEKKDDGSCKLTFNHSSSDEKYWRLMISPSYPDLSHRFEFSLCHWL